MDTLRNILSNKKTVLPIIGLAVLVGGISVISENIKQSQSTNSKASSSNAQSECVSGNAAVAYSFTNTDATRSVSLFVHDNQTNKDVTDDITVAPNQTKSGVLSLGQASVSNGNLALDYVYIDPNAPTDDPNAPSGNPSDNPSNSPSNNPNASIDPNDGGELLAPYTAINCGSTTPGISEAPTGASTSANVTVTPTPSGPTPTPGPKHQATDLNDDGLVNQIDYNLFLREISNQPGE